jgi:uncharacterized protein YdaU (DUF1376 family)
VGKSEKMHYFQFEIKEWISNTAHLSLEEECAYLRLIFYYYDSEKPIPMADVEKVFRRCRISESLGFLILKEFFITTEDNTWIHNRCDIEIEKFKNKSEKASLSAKKMWEKHKNNANDMRPLCESNANAMLITNQESLIINQESDINTIYATSNVAPVDCPHEDVINLYPTRKINTMPALIIIEREFH